MIYPQYPFSIFAKFTVQISYINFFCTSLLFVEDRQSLKFFTLFHTTSFWWAEKYKKWYRFWFCETIKLFNRHNYWLDYFHQGLKPLFNIPWEVLDLLLTDLPPLSDSYIYRWSKCFSPMPKIWFHCSSRNRWFSFYRSRWDWFVFDFGLYFWIQVGKLGQKPQLILIYFEIQTYFSSILHILFH